MNQAVSEPNKEKSDSNSPRVTQESVQTPPAKNTESRKSNVRVVVTYAVTGAFLLAALFLIVFLMKESKYEMAFSVFGTLTGVAGTIIGFWFASREKQSQQQLFQFIQDMQKPPSNEDTQSNA